MKTKILLIVLCCSVLSWGQISIPNTTPVIENFDSMLASGTASFPSNWKMNSQGTGASPTWAAGTNVTAVTIQASSGTPATGGRYNWGTSAATDRALGVMTSSSYANPNSIMAYYRNTNASVLTQLNVSYNLERYRVNIASASVQFYYSTDGSSWTAFTAGDVAAASLPTGANSYTFGSPLTVSVSCSITGLNIAPSGDLYLRWNFNTTGTNSQGIGIDDVSVTASFSSGCATPTTQASTIVPTNITNVGADFSWSSGATATGSMLVITSGATTAPNNGTAYIPNTAWGIAGQIDTNNRVVYRGTGTTVTGITGLTPGTFYTATIYSYNDPGSCYNLISPESATFYTLANEPSAFASTFSCSVASVSQINLSFSAANTIPNANGYIILYREGAAPTGVPVDGAYYPPGTVFGDATVAGQTSISGTDTTFNVTGLNGGTTYYFSLIPFGSYLSTAQTLNYKTTGVIPITNCTTTTAPEINIRGVVGSNPSIADGTSTPQGTNNTLFATVVVGNTQTKVFRIENTGNAILSVSSINFVGANPGDFSYSGIILPININPGTYLDFSVTFTPSAAGVRTATIQINNNDSNEGVYDFALQGNGTIVALVDINVKGNAQSIPDNSIYPVGTNWTAFGVATVGVTTVTRTFTIENLGSTDLLLTGSPYVTVTGPHAALFTVTVQPSTNTISGGSSITFDVTFNPTSPGAKNATIVIASNDPDENPYNFNINGTAKGTSNIYTYGNGNDVVKGSLITSTTNLTDFGSTAVTTGVKQSTYVVSNLSGSTRYFSNITISGTDASMFSVVANPTNNGLSSGNSTSFTINFTPTSVGTKTATITFNVYTDSAHTTPEPIDPVYSFAISGNGIVYILCNNSATQTIAQQDFEVAPATPTWGYSYTTDGAVTITGGTYNNGSGLKNGFIGAQSLQFTGIGTAITRTTVVNLNPIDASQYNNINLSFKVGAFRTGTTQGLDLNDIVQVESSIDGINWSTEAVLRGYTNSRWDFSATGIFNAYYTGTNNGATIDTRNGNAELPWGYATYNVKNLPAVSNLQLRITMTVDRNDEIWAIDNIKIEGQIYQISTWDGTTWSAGTPTSNVKAILNGNYNTSTNGNIQACECQINSGKTLDIPSGTYIEVQSDIINNGIINIANNGSLVQVNDGATNSGTGITNITRTTTPYEKYDYTYWSSPITNSTIGTPFSLWRTDYAFYFQTANFADLNNDGFDDNQDDWQHVTTSTIMQPGKGYAIMAPTSGSFPTTSSVLFSGAVNNGVISIPMALSQNMGDPNDDFNLVGNPYPSAIYANDFINANTNFSGTLYFWTHIGDISSSNPGPNQYNFISDDYASYNLSGGTKSNTNSSIPSGYVASGQGFFVEAITPTNLIFNNSLRSKAYINTNFYKNGQLNTAVEKNRIWLDLQSSEGLFSQQLIGYFDAASLDFDRGYDGLVYQSSNTVSFYSMINNDKYRIQGRPTFVNSDIVPLGYSSGVATTLSINIDSQEGIFNNNQTMVYVEDKLLNIIWDLKQAPYTFSTDAGTFNDRFNLRYTNSTLDTNSFQSIDNNVILSSDEGQIGIKSYTLPIKNVIIYDLLGRKITEKNNIGSNQVYFNNLSLNRQLIIVKIILGNDEVITRQTIL